MPYCLSLLSAMMVIGTGILSLSFRSNCPKMARICSMRKATSRPRFSPASVSTEKWVECTSIHLGSSLANATFGEKTFSAESIAGVPANSSREFRNRKGLTVSHGRPKGSRKC